MGLQCLLVSITVCVGVLAQAERINLGIYFTSMSTEESIKPFHFIQNIIKADLEANKYGGRVHTRFPPEPNGYLHIGHAKSICLNFGLAEEFGGHCNLRFDDTNPEKEDTEYVESIKEDIRWLGFQWHGEVHYASDYFDQLYQYAVDLINAGKAYICSLTPEEAREHRGTLTEPGKNSPYRERLVEENLDLFIRMRNGEFPDGAHVLRAKIDMASPNMNMRDPIIYRIRHAEHHQTGNKWCIYPMYDFTHGQSDALEGITHSICTLEFEDHRPLYDWLIANLDVPNKPQQIEFARLNLNYTVTSKRKLKQLVDNDIVSGWDDPRMPTISGIRRRGYTPVSIRNFCDAIGVTKSNGVVDYGMLESAIRDDLDQNAPRAMCVLNPLKVIITNYPAEEVEYLELARHPKTEAMGKRVVPFTHEVYIDKADFEESPPPKFKRLTVGGEVRLRGSYVIRCDEVIKDSDGEIIALHCSYDAETLGKKPEGRKVKGVIHWVSAKYCVNTEVRLYDRLFTEENPAGNHPDRDFMDFINPDSLIILDDCKAEPSLAQATIEQHFQFEREGYFTVDSKLSCKDDLVFNKTVGLRDSWAKIKE